MIVIYIIRTLFSCFRHNKNFQETNICKGWRCYRNSKKLNPNNTKSWLLCYRETNKLTKYWHCWPDTYFRLGMFMKDFGDIDKMKSFVPQEAYYRYSADKNPQYHILIDDKILFHNIMTMYNLPVPERFFVFQDNVFIKEGKILSDEMVDEILEEVEDERIFIKKYRGGAGSGISIAEKKSNGYYTKDGGKLSALLIREKYTDSNYIFEKQIVQNEAVKRFNPSSVNTVRILTYRNDIISASIRFGGSGDICDNVSKGGVAVSIDLGTGCLGDYGMRMYDVTKYYRHPDSKIKFKGFVVPNWNSILEVVKRSMLLLPYFNSVGFDVAISVDGPVIIEINTGAGINLSQMGKEFGLSECFRK